MDLQKQQNNILKVGLGLNVIILLVGFFYRPLWMFFMGVVVNILLMITYLVITKYYAMFQGLSEVNGIFKTLNNSLEGLDG